MMEVVVSPHSPSAPELIFGIGVTATAAATEDGDEAVKALEIYALHLKLKIARVVQKLQLQHLCTEFFCEAFWWLIDREGFSLQGFPC